MNIKTEKMGYYLGKMIYIINITACFFLFVRKLKVGQPSFKLFLNLCKKMIFVRHL